MGIKISVERLFCVNWLSCFDEEEVKDPDVELEDGGKPAVADEIEITEEIETTTNNNNDKQEQTPAWSSKEIIGTIVAAAVLLGVALGVALGNTGGGGGGSGGDLDNTGGGNNFSGGTTLSNTPCDCLFYVAEDNPCMQYTGNFFPFAGWEGTLSGSAHVHKISTSDFRASLSAFTLVDPFAGPTDVHTAYFVTDAVGSNPDAAALLGVHFQTFASSVTSPLSSSSGTLGGGSGSGFNPQLYTRMLIVREPPNTVNAEIPSGMRAIVAQANMQMLGDYECAY